MPVTNVTANQSYQLPWGGPSPAPNTLAFDIGRIISAFNAIDSDMATNIAALAGKAGLASPHFTGVPTVPTAALGTNTTQAASTAFVIAQIAALIAAAPGALDTLDELAAALGDDANFASNVMASIATKLTKASNLSDLTNAASARSNLGLGTMAVENIAAVSASIVAAATTSNLGSTTTGWGALHLKTTGVINFANGNWTFTHSSGLVTASGALTVSGAFTSPGIDDNGTGERLEIADTVTKIGSAVSASGYNFCRAVNDGYLSIDGGNTGNAGANLLLIGGTHATLAFDWSLQHGAVPILGWDDSAGSFTFSNSSATVLAIIDGGSNVFTGITRFGTTGSSTTPGSGNNLTGSAFTGTGSLYSSVGGTSLILNQVSGTGNIASFNLGGANQGFISGSGTTITYGAFMGSHIGQMLGSAANIELLRGSIVKTCDVMSEWFAFTYTDHDGIEHINEAVPAGLQPGDTFDFAYTVPGFETIEHVTEAEEIEHVDIDDPFIEYQIIKGKAQEVLNFRRKRVPVYDEFPLIDGAGKPVMESVPLMKDGRHVTKTIDGEEVPQFKDRPAHVQVPRKIVVKHKQQQRVAKDIPYTAKATVVRMENDTLVKWELADAAGCERPYGVIAWHDHDESDDWLIAGLGAYVCRIKAGVTVAGGDLIQSSDVTGCGEPITEEMNLSALQIAKRLVAKVGANLPQPIYKGGPLYYPDRSYIVPATIHCG